MEEFVIQTALLFGPLFIIGGIILAALFYGSIALFAASWKLYAITKEALIASYGYTAAERQQHVNEYDKLHEEQLSTAHRLSHIVK